MYSCLQLRNCVGSCFHLRCKNSVFSQTEAVTELKVISENYPYDSIKQTPEEMIALQPFLVLSVLLMIIVIFKIYLTMWSGFTSN